MGDYIIGMIDGLLKAIEHFNDYEYLLCDCNDLGEVEGIEEGCHKPKCRAWQYKKELYDLIDGLKKKAAGEE